MGEKNDTFHTRQPEFPPTFPVISLIPSDVWKGLGAGMDCNHVAWTRAGAAELTPYTLLLGDC